MGANGRHQLNLLPAILIVHLLPVVHHLAGVLGGETVLLAAGSRVPPPLTAGARKVALLVVVVKVLLQAFVLTKRGQTPRAALVAVKVIESISV